MTTEKKTIYVVARLYSRPYPEQFDFHIYSKQSSNREKIREYRDEIRAKFPDCQVVLTTREKAEVMKREWWNKVMEKEKRTLERYYQASDKIQTKQTICTIFNKNF